MYKITFALILGIFTLIPMNGQNEITDIARELSTQGRLSSRGILGQEAPELQVDQWVDGNGEERKAPFLIENHSGKTIVLYCFQAWCPGCHSRGLPSLKKMVNALDGNDDVVFAAIQTVFEGANANTYKRLLEIQKEFDLEIPFGHDPGDASSRNISKTMRSYQTGGTPWFIIIEPSGKVVFNDFHLNVNKTINYLKGK